MNYGMSSVEWVTALLRFNWLRNMRRGNCTQTDMCVYILYVNVCVCGRAWRRQLLKQNTRGFWDVRCALGNIIAEGCSDALQKITHARTHTGSAYLKRTCWNMTTTIQTLTIYGNLAHLPQRHLPSLVFHLTSPFSPFSL